MNYFRQETVERQASHLQRLTLAKNPLQVKAANRKEDIPVLVMMVSGEADLITHVTNIIKSSYVALLVVCNFLIFKFSDIVFMLHAASEGSKEGGVLNNVKMLTVILKFFVESTDMGLASHFQERMLKFTSAYLKYAISIFNDHSTGKLQFEDADMKDMILCTKSSTSYAGKFINLVLRHATEASHPLFEAFDLANDLLDLFTMVEISLGSAYASRLVTALNPWIPDLVLALGPCFINNDNLDEESSYTSSFNHIKLCVPSWLLTCAKIELHEINKEDETETSDFPALKRLRNAIFTLVKGNTKVIDGIGYVLLMCLAVCIEKRDYSTALGLLHFVCVKLVGSEDREWKELDTMLVSLPRIYPIIEQEIGEERDEDEVKKLEAARELLQPVWMYHVYETGRFHMMDEEEEE